MSKAEKILKALWELALDSAAVGDVHSDDLKPLVDKAVLDIGKALQNRYDS